MNILHLKYAVEVAKTQSISKAAENLYMGQPNLSRAIKELEESLGITIFRRTSKGIITTPDGDEFLRRARRIVEQIEEVEQTYRNAKDNKQVFSVCVPRAGYFSHAMTAFARKLSLSEPIDISYMETNAQAAISAVTRGDCSIGFVRFQAEHEKQFKELFREKRLNSETVAEFSLLLITKKDSFLAGLKTISVGDLRECVEIAYGDSYIPIPPADTKKSGLSKHSDKRIYVYDLASGLSLLESVSDSYMYTSPLPRAITNRYGLTSQAADLSGLTCKDVLIYRRDYKLSELDKRFITEVCNTKRECFP